MTNHEESTDSRTDGSPRRADGGGQVNRGSLEGDVPHGSAQTGMPAEYERPERFDWRGWTVVAVVFVSFLLVPAFVLYLPEAHWLLSQIGFSHRQAYIVFPMIPAILLGVTAIWAAVRSL